MLFALALASAGTAPIELDGVFTFSNAAKCQPSREFGDILSDLVRSDGDGKLSAGKVVAAPSVRAAFGKITLVSHQGWTDVEVPVEGTWRGLPVERLLLEHPEGGDPASIVISFRTDPASLTTAAEAAGFPPSGTNHDEGVYEVTFLIESDKERPNITNLRCDIG